MESAYEHFSIVHKSRPIDAVLQDNSVPETVKQRLRSVQQIRMFASTELHLPDNDSYTQYADINREYVSWAVFVAPPFEMKLHTWCFWIAGCVPYRGYFDEDKANAYAHSWQQRGYDVYIGGVPAYSTLGWFSDPVLSTMIGEDELDVAGLMFHELAHQKLYAADDTPFNEAFAETVRIIGQRRWLQRFGVPQLLLDFEHELKIRDQLASLITRYRHTLEIAYQHANGSQVEKLTVKARIFGQLYNDLDELKLLWRQQGIIVRWPEKELNNAALLAFSTYQQQVKALLDYYQSSCDSKLECFYQVAEKLKAGSIQERHNCLTSSSCALLNTVRTHHESG